MKKICFFGGTFDPVHLGHVEMVKKLKETFCYDKIIVMPNGDAPHKTGETNKYDRYEMVVEAFSDMADVVVSDYEIKKQTPSYTWETLSHFKDMYPDCKFSFVIGADSLFGIEKWKNPEVIFNLSEIVVFGRKGFSDADKKADEIEKKYNARIKNIDFSVDCSSTDVRAKIKAGDYVFYDISPQTFLYILKKGLYGTKNISFCDNFENEVKKFVSKKRYLHSLGVAMCAYLLAVKYNENEKDAYFAGLVHDIAKDTDYKDQLKYTEGINISKDEKMIKKMLHAPAGAGLLKKKYNVCDEKILNAVRLHTKGDPAMSLFDKIIYLADFIEPYRQYDGVGHLRKTVFENIDDGIVEACDNTIRILNERNEKTAPCIIDLRNKLRKERKNNYDDIT